jgi:hypothetical protein
MCVLLLGAAAAACASTGRTSVSEFTHGSGGGFGHPAGGAGPGSSGSLVGGGGGPSLASCAAVSRGCSQGCGDFPSDPVLDDKPDDGSPPTPNNAATYFSGGSGAGPGPCLVEPEQGTLIPQNWVRPRVRVIPAAGQNLFQITFHTSRQANDYVVYTSSKTWKMPKTVWDALRADSWGDEVDVTVRGVDTTSGSAPTSASGSFTIAPAAAGGAMIYWATTGDQNGLSWLEGFAPGDEGVATTLDVSSVQAKLYRDQSGNANGGGATQCIGCHAAVPDGKSVSFVDFWPWPASAASVDPSSTGAIPSWLTPGGAQALSLPWLGIATYSKTLWGNGEQVAVTSYGCPQPVPGNQQSYPWNGATCSNQTSSSLVWIDLASAVASSNATSGWQLGQDVTSAGLGKSFGFLERSGDTRGAEFPNFSHDGTTIVYVSTDAGKDGRLGSGEADLFTVPYSGGQGGPAQGVGGASSPSAAEYYPAFSPDDAIIAFVRATTQGPNGMYYNPGSEVFMVPAWGGTPVRVSANDPPACEGTPGSPGVTNSWPKWSPEAEVCGDGNTYYWLVFSSAREGVAFNAGNGNFKAMPDGPTSQLYIAGVVVDKTGYATTTPALYIWNQATRSAKHNGDPQSNHTPIWEEVSIPRPPPPMTQ